MAAGYSLVQPTPGEHRHAEIVELAGSGLIQSSPTDLESRTRSVAAQRSGRSGGRTADRSRTGSVGAPTSWDLGDGGTDIADVASLTKAVQAGAQLARRSEQLERALAGGAPSAGIYRGAEFAEPTRGAFISGFGGRWGAVHYGIDLANAIGTPIYAVTDGTVISSGPASGFGMWVRLLHPGGWISVYGHINRSLVHRGEEVRAGEQIAEMGNRGQTTGPHLHFEIWDPNGKKLDPLPWLSQRGIRPTTHSRIG